MSVKVPSSKVNVFNGIAMGGDCGTFVGVTDRSSRHGSVVVLLNITVSTEWLLCTIAIKTCKFFRGRTGKGRGEETKERVSYNSFPNTKRNRKLTGVDKEVTNNCVAVISLSVK